MSGEKLVFTGLIVSPISLDNLSIKRGFLTVENGKITRKGNEKEFLKFKKSDGFSEFKLIQLSSSQFLLPGFVDCHTHAPQFPNIGLGLDRPLLEWLEQYTFPLERKYDNIEFAASIYDRVVKRLLKHGTTTACYFGSLHLKGTLELVKSVIKHCQRALVGKVSMNMKNNADYYNDTDKELKDVDDFVKQVLAYENELVAPVVTPRFAVSCDKELMTGLAELAEKYQCRIQSHISENLKEIEYVLQTNPTCTSYADVYDQSNILNNRCIMAHAVHLTESELALLSAKGVSVAHCPASNTRLRSGLCPLRKIVNSGITVGLGTDVSGGDSASILDAMRRAMDVSLHLELQGGRDEPFIWKEVIYLATLGGAKALNLDDKIGSLDVGKDFDALLVDVYLPSGTIDQYPHPDRGDSEEAFIDLIQRFVHLGDDRNLKQVYVKGQQIIF